MKKLKHLILVAFAGIALLTNCVKDRTTPVDPVTPPDPKDYPDFSTTSNFTLDVDYESTGIKTLINIYTEFPYITNEDGSIAKKQINPAFAIYSDDNGRFSGKITLPDATKEVYLCTPTIGLPKCVYIEVANKKISFKLSDIQKSEANTKVNAGSPSGNNFPYILDAGKNLYSLCKWGNYGKPLTNQYYTLTNVSSSVSARWTNKILTAIENAAQNGIGGENPNIIIAKKAENDKGEMVDVIDAEIFLTFVDETAWYQNSFGYYYYSSDQKPSDPSRLKKYIIFPNTSVSWDPPFAYGYEPQYWPQYAPLSTKRRVALKYIDDAGNIHDRFPAGLTIGWFIMPNSYSSGTNKLSTDKQLIYSDASYNYYNNSSYISLYDKETGRIVTGVEDGTDNSYDDIIFFASSTPNYAIKDPTKPEIDDSGGTVVPDGIEESFGTFAFEDLWPSKGDYDMNDVIVEYKRIITFGKDNKVKKIEDHFKPKHAANSASFKSAFAYQVSAGQTGTYTLQNGVQYESGTNSFIVFTDSEQARGEEYTLVREFNGANTFDKMNFKEYNPFIIPLYNGKVPRKEVHLPKHQPTIYVDHTLLNTKDDAYYVDKSGKYPFAINIPAVNFTPVMEGSPIGSKGQYEDFNKWVESGCKEYTDWYKRK